MEKIEIQVTYESKDYFRAYLETYLSFVAIFYLFLGVVIYGMFLGFLFLTKISGGHFLEIVVSTFIFVILFGLAVSLLGANARKHGEKEYEFVFSDDSVEINGRLFKSRFDWAYLSRVEETGSYYLLSTQDGKSLLPKRSFQNYEQIAAFQNLLRSKLNEEARFKKTKENLGLK